MTGLNEVCHYRKDRGKHSGFTAQFVLVIRYRPILKRQPNQSMLREWVPYVSPEVRLVVTDVSGSTPAPQREIKSVDSRLKCCGCHVPEVHGGGAAWS